MRITARYDSAPALARDVVEQLTRGGLLVRTEVPPGLELYATIELEIACGADAVVVPASVLQLFPGLGVAVAVDDAGRDAIDVLARGGADASADADTAAAGTAGAGPATARRDRPTTGAPAGGAPRAGSAVEKIQQALRGDRDARAAVLRDPNRTLHVYVLRNPALTLDEVAAMARMTTISVDVLRQIAERREWGHRPEIAIALVRNPTLPPPVAIPLLAHVTPADLKQLAKDTRTREPIQRAARKRVLG